MRPVEQTRTELGSGNCLAACIASILEVDCDEVPPRPFTGEQYEWLRGRGFAMVRVRAEGLYSGGGFLPRCYYIMSALSPRAETLHAVVCYADEIVWDPHPQREMGLASDPAEYLFLVPVDAAQAGESSGAVRDKSRALDALVAGIPMPSFNGTGWGWACLPDAYRLTVAQAQRLSEWYGEHYAERFATAEAALLAAAEAAELEERTP